MDLGLNGRTAAVAAASKGLGYASAAALAAEGVRVAICSRDRGRVESAASEIGRDAVPIVADVSTAEGAGGFVEQAEKALGPIDILVPNAGGPPPGTFASTDLKAYRDALDLNLFSTIAMCQRAVPGMRERGWGRILVTASSGGVQPIANLGISNVLRAGLATWVKTLSNELGADGVTVNQIQPGRIHTERVDDLDRSASERLGKSVDEIAAASRATIPLGRYGTVAEYAAAAVFLMSGPASYITGTTLRVDGGYIKAV